MPVQLSEGDSRASNKIYLSGSRGSRLVGDTTDRGGLRGPSPIGDHLAEHGRNQPQIDVSLANGWDISGQTQMYRFGDDPLSVPTVSEEDAAGTHDFLSSGRSCGAHLQQRFLMALGPISSVISTARSSTSARPSRYANGWAPTSRGIWRSGLKRWSVRRNPSTG